jgi:hypothetical protein
MHDDTVIPACQRVDRLFIDTTFLDPVWIFPSKEKSIQEIIRIVNEHEKSSRVFLEARSEPPGAPDYH